MVRDLRAIFAAAAAVGLACAHLHAQTPVRSPRSQVNAALPGEYAMEQETRERWMHGRQLSRFTPFTSDRSWVSVDSLRDSGTSVAERRLWDLVPTFPRAAPRVGLRWTDTLVRAANIGPRHQSMRGTRASRIVGDTVVDGRRLWIVRDSARVIYEEHYLESERTLDTTVQVSRIATGTLRGVHLYDPQLRLFRVRDDTTRLAGNAVLQYPDGRSFRTPARYERVRRWRLNDPMQYAARVAELRAKQRDFGGMVLVPGNELERRLAANDPAARDSLVRAWQRTTDPDEAAGIFSLLSMWSRDERSSGRLDSLRIAAGDTAFAYSKLANRAFTTERPLDTADVRAMLRYMEDPSLAWGLNMSRDWLYENLVQSLTTWPRAVDGSPYGRSERCTIDACRLLGAQRRIAREPRTRDVALVALATLEPRQWADTLLAHAGPQHPLLHDAVLLANGVGATWTAALKAPLPPPNSDWRVWLEWMDGHDPKYNTPGQGRSADTKPNVRFEESHWTAIRFYEVRTGRDVVGELRRSFDAASSDSARLIFATMLQPFGGARLTESQVTEAYGSGTPAGMSLARRALLHEFYNNKAVPMSAAASAPFIDRFLASVVDSVPLWPYAAPDSGTPGRGARPIVHARVRNVFLNHDGVPDIIRSKWEGRIQIIGSAEWEKRDVRSAGVFYTVSPLRSWGRFVRFEVTDSERTARAPNRLPAQYGAAKTYYLMELNGEWVIVAEEGWVT